MTENLLPFRMSLLRHLAVADGTRTGQDLLASLAKDYGQERQCTLDAVLDNLFNMSSLGLVNMDKEYFDDDHNLVISFSITDEGRACQKYYPPTWSFKSAEET